VRREIKAALRELNQQAAKLMTRGDYGGASAVADRGRMMGEFDGRVDALRREWRDLWTSSSDHGVKDVSTPLWEYYRLVLQTLVALGGEASRRDVEKHLASRVGETLKPGDLKPKGRTGRAQWQVMLRRVRKPMVREKYLEDVPGKHWRITPLGRQVAEKGMTATPES
jgi:hypothetical protein